MIKFKILLIYIFLNCKATAQWLVVFEDDFLGNKLNEKYWYNHRHWGTPNQNNDTHCYIDSENVKVENGLLYLTLKRDFTYYPPYNTTGAYVWSKILFRYGVFEAKIKIPDTRGCWTAFWLYGSATNGDEIDIFEQYWSSNHNKHNSFYINNYQYYEKIIKL